MSDVCRKPNIIITGTPGVGKTTLCEVLASRTNLIHLPINSVIKENECYESWDKELSSYIVDEEKLLDEIEPKLSQGGYIIDWHACEIFPDQWIDYVIVLRAQTSAIYDRLTSRGYSDRKLQENIDTEIMQVLLEEAIQAFGSEKVTEMQSNDLGDIDCNFDRVRIWLRDRRISIKE